jgi:hypothetical protein
MGTHHLYHYLKYFVFKIIPSFKNVLQFKTQIQFLHKKTIGFSNVYWINLKMC